MTDSVANQEDGGRAEAPRPDDHEVVEEQDVEGQDPQAAPEAAPDPEAMAAILDEIEAELAEDDDVVSGPESTDAEAEAMRREFEELNDRHLRLAAEFNNYRRRVDQERLDLWARAQAELVGKLVDVLDDLQRVAGLDLTNATVEGIMEGIDLVERKFVRALEDAGAEVLDPTGQKFDPESMEAMMRVPAESEDEDDTVHQVFQKGYAFKGQLVRAARVSVLKHG